jgi:hypothetical protein
MNHHYVPQWYQEGFFDDGRKTLAYLDLNPRQETLVDGRIVTHRSRFDAPTSRCFCESDLYSTFFGVWVNDEIERRLFGDIDTRGSRAVRAFTAEDVREWHRHFQTLFEYIDVQKIRTPKGLDWLKAQYPSLTQNELMMEMQGIRMMHCTIWTEGVREIVSAEDSDVKFIVTDHPVTIYNHASPPDVPMCAYPYDPAIALKASQTIFPLNRNFCLVLTNLEYAKDSSVDPLEKRTFARSYRNSMVRTDKFIRTRKLASQDVARINYILKARARRFVAAGCEEWLFPENAISEPWSSLRETLSPPADELWNFGGKLYAKFDNGHVHYQDEFGRTEEPREFLIKEPPSREPRPKDACGCGSGKTYKTCCKSIPEPLRPTWDERSIRERNLTLFNGIVDILGLDQGKDWAAIRRELTDEQISRTYLLYQALWPLETDFLKLLPKPDGRPRAVFTGSIHPHAIADFALGASLYFGELIVEHPFVHAGAVAKKFSPVDHPQIYHLEFLQSVVFFLNIMPLVDLGLVNLIPDPGNFDFHLREQTMHMARERTATLTFDPSKEPRIEEQTKLDFRRDFLMQPREALVARLRRDFPAQDAEELDEMLRVIELMKEHDPLAALREDIFGRGGEDGGQFRLMKLAPNFEMAMYLAQATGACIVTDSPYRWEELQRALRPRLTPQFANLTGLATKIASTPFLFPNETMEITELAFSGETSAYPKLMRDAFQYLAQISVRGVKPNWETHLAARFDKSHLAAQAVLKKRGVSANLGHVSCAFPLGGIQDNTVNRLLLMSSSERHLPSVPMAFFLSTKAVTE